MKYPDFPADGCKNDGFRFTVEVHYYGSPFNGHRFPVVFWGNVSGGFPAVLLYNADKDYLFWVLPRHCRNPQIADVPPLPQNESEHLNFWSQISGEFWVPASQVLAVTRPLTKGE